MENRERKQRSLGLRGLVERPATRESVNPGGNHVHPTAKPQAEETRRSDVGSAGQSKFTTRRAKTRCSSYACSTCWGSSVTRLVEPRHSRRQQKHSTLA